MLKHFKLLLVSSILFASILTLSSCGKESSNESKAEQSTGRLVDQSTDQLASQLVDNPTDHSTITLTISQETYTQTVPEDLTFHELLNAVDAVSGEEDIPAPEVWHTINYDPKQDISLSVGNCRKLDLLDLLAYYSLDAEGRPNDYEYFPICGSETAGECSTTSTIPAEAQQELENPEVNHFAFTGICIDQGGVGDIGFITFFKKG